MLNYDRTKKRRRTGLVFDELELQTSGNDRFSPVEQFVFSLFHAPYRWLEQLAYAHKTI